MAETTPEALHDSMKAALSAGDAHHFASLFERDGVLFESLEHAICGREAIEAAVESFLSKHPRFVLVSRRIVQAGDLALIQSHWRIDETPSDGQGRRIEVNASVVAQRGVDGTWKVMIDCPMPSEGSQVL